MSPGPVRGTRGNQNLRLLLELGQKPLVPENFQNLHLRSSSYNPNYIHLHLLSRVCITELFGEGTKALLHHLPNPIPYPHGILVTPAMQCQDNTFDLR